jgi:hypothetical protein
MRTHSTLIKGKFWEKKRNKNHVNLTEKSDQFSVLRNAVGSRVNYVCLSTVHYRGGGD